MDLLVAETKEVNYYLTSIFLLKDYIIGSFTKKILFRIIFDGVKSQFANIFLLIQKKVKVRKVDVLSYRYGIKLKSI